MSKFQPGLEERSGHRQVARAEAEVIGPRPRSRQLQFEHMESRRLLSVTINEVPVPTALGVGSGITAGPDGNLWFTDCTSVSPFHRTPTGAEIGMINPTTHAITTFPGPSDVVGEIAFGPGGNLWFIEVGGNQIGEIPFNVTETTATTVTAPPNPVPAGQPVVFTATVINTSGTAAPTGTVDLVNGTTVIGMGTLGSNGQAAIMASQPPGSYSIAAVYTGTNSLQTSRSTALPVTFNQSTPTVSWPMPADIRSGTALGAAQLDATASVPGTFTYTPSPGTVLPSGQGQVLSVTFVPDDAVDYTSVTTSTTINVLLPPQVETIARVSSKQDLTAFTATYNEPLNGSSAGSGVLYHVDAAVTKIVKKHGETLFTKALAIRVTPNSSGNAVTINLKKPYKGRVQVTVQGTITAANGASNSVDFPMVFKERVLHERPQRRGRLGAIFSHGRASPSCPTLSVATVTTSPGPADKSPCAARSRTRPTIP